MTLIAPTTFDFDTPLDRSRLVTTKWEMEWKRRNDPELLSFGTADMDFRSPPQVLDALRAVIDTGHLGYPYQPPEYFAAIVGFYNRRFGWGIKPEWISFHVGVYAAMGALIDALTEPGDEILFQTPVHGVFREVVEYAGRIAREVPLSRVGTRYTIDATALQRAITPKTRMLLLCNPHNPVGRAWTRAELEDVQKVCAAANVVVVSDEVYSGLLYPTTRFTPFGSLSSAASQGSVTLFSASKSFNLTGLKHSLIITENADFLSAYHRVLMKGDLVYGGSVFGQAAGLVAMRDCDAWSRALMKYVGENLATLRSFLASEMPRVKLIEPEATYLAWLDFTAYRLSGQEIQAIMENDAHVLLTHGHTMGAGGGGHVRLNLATQRALLERGLNRIAKAFRSLATDDD